MNILSGCTKIRFDSIINHASYANIFNYKYKFDNKKRNLLSIYDHKILSILELPIDNEWWFWVDDDVFFTDYNKSFDSFFAQKIEKILIHQFSLFFGSLTKNAKNHKYGLRNPPKRTLIYDNALNV